MQINLRKALFPATIVFVAIIRMLASCKKDDSKPQLDTVDSFTPTSGQVGATVTITGTNFIADNNVQFNGTIATVTAAMAIQLTTTMPTGATSGKIIVSANGLAATSVTDFVVNQPPTIL
jgi:IPT/TIG domain